MHRSSEPISVLRTWNKESWLHFGLLYFICYIYVFRIRSEFILLPKHPERLLESGTFFLHWFTRSWTRCRLLRFMSKSGSVVWPPASSGRGPIPPFSIGWKVIREAHRRHCSTDRPDWLVTIRCRAAMGNWLDHLAPPIWWRTLVISHSPRRVTATLTKLPLSLSAYA